MESVILDVLKVIWISSVTAFWVITLYFKYFAEKSIEYYKNEFKKNLHDYTLYSLKRNEIYQESFSLAVSAYMSLPSLNGEYNYPTFINLNREEITKIFEANFAEWKFHISEKDVKDIKWLNQLFYVLFCKNNYWKFTDFIAKNSVYMSTEIEYKIEEVRKILFSLVNVYCITRAKNWWIANSDTDYKKESKLRNDYLEKIDELKKMIQENIFKS